MHFAHEHIGPKCANCGPDRRRFGGIAHRQAGHLGRYPPWGAVGAPWSRRLVLSGTPGESSALVVFSNVFSAGGVL